MTDQHAHHGHGHHHGHGPADDNAFGVTHRQAHGAPAGQMLGLLDRAVGEAQAIIDQTPDDAWQNPSPCDGWAARDVVNHLVQSNIWTVQLLQDGSVPRPAGDALGDHPAQAFADSAHAMLAALRQPGALAKPYETPFGTMPGSAFAGFLAVHIANHAWDFAKATGQRTDFAPDLNETLLGMAKMMMGRMPRENSPFAAVVEVSDDLPAADRLAAFLGRQP